MLSKSRLVVTGGFLAFVLAHADTVNLATTPVGLGANDSVIWSPQLGADGATIPNAFVATSTGGKTVNGSFATAGGSGSVATVCNGCSWSPLTGAFNNNDFVIWSFDSSGSTGIGPVTLTFAAGLSGVGAVVQADAPGQFTAKIELFNSGNTSLGSVTATSNAAGDALFIGALDVTAPNATKAVFSLTASQTNGTTNFLGDFAVGALALNVPAAVGSPALTITKTHIGNFTQGQTGATYTITVTNSGTVATTAAVSVSDTVPAGLTATSISGTNWVCTQPAGPCTNSTLEAASGSFPALTLTVNVAANAAASVTNSATVSGGGATVGSTANDPTTINAGVQPGISDAFQVRYAANLNVGDSFVNVTNSGASAGNICANVYTFDPAEELISCCTCSVTPNGLQTLSVLKSLISNPLTPAIPSSVVIKIVASAGTCNAAAVSVGELAPGMLAWGASLHARPTSPVSYAVTETAFAQADLSAAELAHITSTCGFIQSNGSGFGICKGCAAGGLGATSAQ